MTNWFLSGFSKKNNFFLFFVLVLGTFAMSSCTGSQPKPDAPISVPTELRCHLKCQEVNDARNTLEEFDCIERNNRKQYKRFCRIVITYQPIPGSSAEDQQFCLAQKPKSIDETEDCPGPDEPKDPPQSKKKPEAPKPPPLQDPMEKGDYLEES